MQALQTRNPFGKPRAFGTNRRQSDAAGQKGTVDPFLIGRHQVSDALAWMGVFVVVYLLRSRKARSDCRQPFHQVRRAVQQFPKDRYIGE